MKTRYLLASAMIVTLSVSAVSHAGGGKNNFKFKPVDSSANALDWELSRPWKLAKGFVQTIVSDESNLDIYDGGRNDWHDMNTVNETGYMAGRYMYRTHELLQPEGGTVSVVDLKTGETSILAQSPGYNALDGIRWTPWGTIVFAEGIAGGRLFEIELNKDLLTAKVINDRPAVGRIAHEGIDFDTKGNIYIVSEHPGLSIGCNGASSCGNIYKFVPDEYGNLSAGLLYALKVTGPDGIGQGEWVGPINPDNARDSGIGAGAYSYQRTEDLEVINDVLYVAISEGPRDEKNKELYEGRVISIDLDSLEISNFVKPDVNVAIEIGKPGEEGFQTGFDNVSNLAEAPNGDLVMIEDNKPSDIWFASTETNRYGASDDVRHFASLTDPKAKGTGIYFSPLDDKTLYVNVQDSAAEDGDATWAITRKSNWLEMANIMR